MNGDLTPAEACELKASPGGASEPSVPTSLSGEVASRPENVWTARKLAALSMAEGASNNPSSADQLSEKNGEKLKNASSSSTAVTPIRQEPQDKRKKSSKSGMLVLMQICFFGNLFGCRH